MLGQPVSMLIPNVVGFRLTGEMAPGHDRDRPRPDRHRDAAQPRGGRQVRRVLRRGRRGGAAGRPGHDRQHEPGVRLHLRDLPDRRRDAVTTCASPGVRPSSSPWSRPTPRSRACGTTRAASPTSARRWSSTCRPSSRPWPGPSARRTGCRCGWPKPPSARPCARSRPAQELDGLDEASEESFPASDPAAAFAQKQSDRPVRLGQRRRGRRPAERAHPAAAGGGHRSRARPRRGGHRRDHQLHQHVQPAGHGRRRPAREERRRAGPDPQALGEDLARARVEGRHGLLRGAPASPPTWRSSASTWSGTAARPASATPARCPTRSPTAVHRGDLAVVSVLSGNRNFEGRINPDVKMNYLASPPLVVAYALAGTMDIDLNAEPLGTGSDGQPVYLRDIWPAAADITRVVGEAIKSEMFATDYADVFAGDERWRSLPLGEGGTGTLLLGPRVDLRAPPALLRGHARRPAAARRHRGRAGAGPARRQRHHRPHLPGRLDQEGLARGPVPDRARGRAARLQLLRLAARQPRGDDPRHVREHPAAQPARPGHRGRRHACTCPTASR